MSAKRKASTIYTDWWGRRWGQGPEKAEVRATQEQSLKKNKPESKGTKKYTQFKQKDTEMRCGTKSQPSRQSPGSQVMTLCLRYFDSIHTFTMWDAKPWSMQSQWTCFLNPGNTVWGSQPWRTDCNQSRLSPSIPGPRKASGLTARIPRRHCFTGRLPAPCYY